MTETTTAKYPETEHANPTAFTADRVARLVTELGAGWARYGLTIGRLALQQSAKALETTSEILGAVATKLESKAAEKKDGEIVVEAEPKA
ncbi:MAG: hypothetical protein ACXWUG_03020 [Polyangiales bacterium]